MKLLLIIASLLIGLTTFAQKKNPIKYKAKNFKAKYTHLAEFPGYESRKGFHFDIKNGDQVYTFKRPNKNAAAINELIIPIGYLPGTNATTGESTLGVELNINDQKSGAFEIIKTIEKIKKSDGSYYDKELYSYQFMATQKYQLLIKNNSTKVDVSNEQTTLEHTYNWPKNFTSSRGYTTKELLRNEYSKFTADDEKFQKLKAKAMVQSIINKEVKLRLKSALHRNKVTTAVWFWIPKTKDVRFASLDSAYIYLNQGLDAMKLNQKNEIYLNGHEESVYKNFNNAYRIFSFFTYDKVLEYLGNEDFAKEFVEFNRIPLVMSAMFTSRFNEAVTVLEGHVTDKKAKEQAVADEKNQTKKVFGELGLALSDGGKVNREVQLMMPLLIREIEFFELFKERYSYFK